VKLTTRERIHAGEFGYVPRGKGESHVLWLIWQMITPGDDRWMPMFLGSEAECLDEKTRIADIPHYRPKGCMGYCLVIHEFEGGAK